MGKMITDEGWHRECAYAYFLKSVDGIGNKTMEKMYEQFGSYENMYRQGEQAGLSEKQKTAWKEQKEKWNIKEEYQKLLYNKIWCIPKHLTGYPDKLLQIDDPPSALFVKGKLPDERMPAVAVVGARNCSPYGRAVAGKLGRELAANGIQVISGLARGVDGISQRSAVEYGGASFGILGCGVDICYPEENTDIYEKLSQGEHGGGIISEFLPAAEPAANHFPMRNRIISGLSDLLVVVEAKEKSGTFITVSSALEQGKDVYAVPGRIGDGLSYGCNRLIAQGAGIIYSVDEFINEILGENFYIREKCQRENCQTAQEEKEMPSGANIKKGGLEETVLSLLDIQYRSLDDIMEKAGGNIRLQEILAALATLECRNLVESEGSFYRKKENIT